HSFNVKGEYNDPVKGKITVENTGACKSCHGNIASFNITAKGDYDGNGKIEGIQDEVEGLLALLAAKLPKDATGAVMGSGVTKTNSTEAQRAAIWNYKVVEIDNSKGIHNTAFTVQLLQKTYKQLTGTDVPKATLR
ncbi:MAG: hypothetical protein Q7O66_10145, partial [Dehalococcoidia bacterium]|nr:hypothetical protein [Dehalococcoidia bacterium]